MSVRSEVSSTAVPEVDPLSTLSLHFEIGITNLGKRIEQFTQDNDLVNKLAEAEVLSQALVATSQDTRRGIRVFFRRRQARSSLQDRLSYLQRNYFDPAEKLTRHRDRYMSILDDISHGSTISARIEFLTNLNDSQHHLNAAQNLYMYSDTDDYPDKKYMARVCDRARETSNLLSLINPQEGQVWDEYFTKRKEGISGMRAQFLP